MVRGVHVISTRVWRSEAHPQEPVLSFYYMDLEDGGGDQTQAVRLDGSHLYPSSFKCLELYSGIHLSYWGCLDCFEAHT